MSHEIAYMTRSILPIWLPDAPVRKVMGVQALQGLPAETPPILSRLKMEAAPVLDYLARDDIPSLGALGPVSMLKAFADSVGRSFIKGHAFGNRLCPESST